MHVQQQLFLGLAHARPTERNGDEELRGALGAYFYAVALADDGAAFVERVRVQLEELDFELADLSDVRPLDEAIREEHLAPALLELANRAATENTTRFGAFHVYEEETPEPDEHFIVEYKQEPRHVIELGLMCGGIVGVRYASAPTNDFQGFVVGLGPSLVLVHLADDRAYLDGYAALPVADIFDAWTVDASTTVTERALRLAGEHPQPLPELDLTSIRSVLEYANANFPLVTVHLERDIPDVCFIGRIERLGDDDFTLATITPGAQWQDEETFAYEAVTRVGFGGRYEDALARVAAVESA
jgi:hypothetical protein